MMTAGSQVRITLEYTKYVSELSFEEAEKQALALLQNPEKFELTPNTGIPVPDALPLPVALRAL